MLLFCIDATAMLLRTGDFMWQLEGTTREIHNASATPIQFVEFELK